MFFLIQLSRLFLIVKIMRLPPLELKRDKSPEGLSTRCSSDHKGFRNIIPASCLCVVSQIVRYSDHMVAQITRKKFHGEADSVFYRKECRGEEPDIYYVLCLCSLTIMSSVCFVLLLFLRLTVVMAHHNNDNFRHFHHWTQNGINATSAPKSNLATSCCSTERVSHSVEKHLSTP